MTHPSPERPPGTRPAVDPAVEPTEPTEPAGTPTPKPRLRSRRWFRAVAWSVAGVMFVVVALGGVVVWQNTFDLDEEKVTISQGGHTLEGVLAKPKGKGPHGLVVFVHGDGPTNATHDDGYRPIWESFAKAGYASLSWHKPGVAGAPGNWLTQSMDDRADEAAAAIAWARARSDIDGRRVGLWGASQGGWVMPKVAARTRISFVIGVSPAINWLRQGRYNLLSELREKGASPAEVDREVAKSDTIRRLLAEHADHRRYIATVGAEGAMSEARWGFVSRNNNSDVTADLPALRGVPVLLVLPDHDVNVDVADTEAGYRRELDAAGALTVKHYKNATHDLVKKNLEDSELKITLVALFAPRSLFADGYLADQRTFLRNIEPAPATTH
ncbi:alpha/beta hydrolase [Embleya sp. NPDC005971]|uniref:alpha/beta hydrolase family protein n=1 Tax=Embleya sp. NPDC005971 TaxID=3156724 RepID=UPI0033C6B1EA